MPQIARKVFIIIALSVIAAQAIVACSSGGGGDGANFDPETGRHISDWINNHGPWAMKAPDTSTGFASCEVCHGADFQGGMSKQSCFTCHGVDAPHTPAGVWKVNHQTTNTGNAPACAKCHSGDSTATPAPAGTPAGCFNNTLCHVHPSDWAQRDKHGAAAKAFPDGSQFAGFVACEACHGADFNGGTVGVSCFTCHGVDAAHSRATLWQPRHSTTFPTNAEACALCHKGESGVPVPAGTPINCFNNTLCHGMKDVHPDGWADPSKHGAAAKSAPGYIKGFASCQSCHANDFKGGGTSVSCYKCHTHEPHPDAPWNTENGVRHTNTNRANAVVCAICHAGSSSHPAPNGTPVDCFNNTLCHGNQ